MQAILLPRHRPPPTCRAATHRYKPAVRQQFARTSQDLKKAARTTPFVLADGCADRKAHHHEISSSVQQESAMSQPQKSNFEAEYKSKGPKTRKWAELSGGEKAKKVVQICVCIVTFGMIFPNAMS